MIAVIYGLAPIGKDGALEATGEIHFYCGTFHAKLDAASKGYTGEGYSEPEYTYPQAAVRGTVCERCGKEIC